MISYNFMKQIYYKNIAKIEVCLWRPFSILFSFWTVAKWTDSAHFKKLQYVNDQKY